MLRTLILINKYIFNTKWQFYKLLQIQLQKYLEFTKHKFLAAAHFNFLIDNCFVVIVALCFATPKFSYASQNGVATHNLRSTAIV